MEKNSYSISKQESNKTVCERLIRVIQTTSPFRAIRFASQQVHEGDAVTPAASPNVSLMTRTPARDRCTRISRESSKKEYELGGLDVASATSPSVSLMYPTTTPLRDRCPRVIKESDHVVPVIFRPSRQFDQSSPKVNSLPSKPKATTAPAGTAHSKATVLPIHGLENRVPTMSHVSEKSSIAESINGMFTEYIDRAGRKIRSPTMVGAPGIGHDSFNDKISDFISRAKHKFHSTPSILDSSFKEKRVK